MGWVLDLVATLGLWGSLALLAWGAALGVEEALARDGDRAKGAERAPVADAPACPRGR